MSEAPRDPLQEKLKATAAKIDAMAVAPKPDVSPIKLAFAAATPLKKKERAPAPPASSRGGEDGGAPSTGGGRGRGEVVEPPTRLPPNSPVTALGKQGMTYFYLDSLGQYVALQAKEIGRLPIISLFGGKEYLVANWRAYSAKGPKDDFDHGLLAPVLIASCTDKGLFNPMERVRGPGAWLEDDGGLIMHCGDILHSSKGGRAGTGLRRGMLYPASPALPEPIMDAKPGIEGPAAALLDRLDSWNWARGTIDAKLALGWIGAAKIGGAAEWRPMIWITGGRGSGKSTLQKMIRWIFGRNGLIHSEDASRAGIFQRVGHSALPVSLDEIEAKGNNQRAQEIIELARISSSGGLVLRGGADGNPSEFTARNCFAFSSILIPPLRQADRSRMAILELNRLRREETELRDLDENEDEDPVLGDRLRWERIGRELSGRLLEQWARYFSTFRAYRRALIRGGHDARAADQFGSLGAAYDLLMHDSFEESAAAAWAAMLPADTLAETSGYLAEEQACLMHLAAAMPPLFRDGAKETVSKWLRTSRKEREDGGRAGDNTDANRLLAKLGLKLYRDGRGETGANGAEKPGPYADMWWVAVSNTHEELAKIFAGTQWGGLAGAPGTWSQALRRINDSHETRLRIDQQRHYCVSVPWEAFFPPQDAIADRDESHLVDVRDRG